MLCKIQLCAVLCLAVFVARALAFECSTICPSCPVVQCQYGSILDPCGCCSECLAGPDEQCATNFMARTYYPPCMDGLSCVAVLPPAIYIYFPGTCMAVAVSSSSSPLPLPTSTAVLQTPSRQAPSSTVTRISPSPTTAAATPGPLLTATSGSDRVTRVWASDPLPTASTGATVKTSIASSVLLTATPAPNPTNSTLPPRNSIPPAACMERCSVNYCSASSSNICSAQGDLAFQPVSQRGVCQHTACGACFILLSPACSPCPDPVTSTCLTQYSTCITNFYFRNATNNAIMRLDDPRAASVQGRVLCQVSSVDNSLSQSSIRRAVRRAFGLSTKTAGPPH